MFVQLNERVLLNLSKITRTKIDHVEDGIRVRFYDCIIINNKIKTKI